MYTLGIPIPSYMDGLVLTKLFTGDFIQHNKGSFIEITYKKAKIKAKIQRVLTNKLVEPQR
ncbi:MAG: hypothetical protein DRO14_05900 [Thermoprotei archaeon]|nr:MAG: hypothetical protein DRO14_05900 [Thermoprotei archaeon]